jgi:hypothetical protein
MMPTHGSPYSWVAAPSLNLNEGMVWLSNMFASYKPCVHLMRTFISRRVQPLRRREMTMWMYPGTSCPDRSSTEFDDAEINA